MKTKKLGSKPISGPGAFAGSRKSNPNRMSGIDEHEDHDKAYKTGIKGGDASVAKPGYSPYKPPKISD